MSRTITMGRHLRKCRKERQQLKEENAALKQKMFEMTSFSRGRIAELSRAGDGKSKPASHYTADAVLKDLGLLGAQKQGVLGLGAQKQGDLGLGAQKQGGRRKTRKKKRTRKKKNRRKRRKTRRKSARAGYTPDFYKKRVDRQEEANQWKLNRKMNVAKRNKDKQKIKLHTKQLIRSFNRQKYHDTPGHKKNQQVAAEGIVRKSGPAIDDSLRRGLLRHQKQRKSGRNQKQPTIGGKRRRKTKRRKR